MIFLGYIKNFQVYDPQRVGRITVELQGRVKDCRALTYRQDIKAKDLEAYRLRMLPTHQVGLESFEVLYDQIDKCIAILFI